MRFDEINEGSLQPANLRKNSKRLQRFADKYQKGELFVATGDPWDKPSIQLQVEPEKLEMMRKGQTPPNFLSVDGRVMAWNKFEKTDEFGGKGAGSSTRDEDEALGSLGEQFAKLKGDAPEVALVIGDREVMVAGFVSTPGTPKSDFHAIDASGNEVAWISHKKGSQATDFGQWGGCSEKELEVVYDRYPELQKEIMSFVDAVKQEVGGNVFQGGRGSTYGRKIQNGELKGIAVYGRDFVPHKQGGADRGRQNVDLVLQGNPYFDGNRLLADGNVHVNGERVEGSFEPILIARKSSDRKNFGLAKARFSFYPEGGRKIGKWI